MDIEQAARKCISAAIMTVIALACMVFLFDLNRWWLTALAIAIYPLSLAYGFIYGMFFARQEDVQVFSEEDQAEMEAMLDEQTTLDTSSDPHNEYFFEELDETTELSEAVIGRFKDADIHEFVVVNHPGLPGQKLKCTFSHVVHDTNLFSVPEGCWFVLLMPGIVYTAPAEPEFTGGESSSLE